MILYFFIKLKKSLLLHSPAIPATTPDSMNSLVQKLLQAKIAQKQLLNQSQFDTVTLAALSDYWSRSKT